MTAPTEQSAKRESCEISIPVKHHSPAQTSSKESRIIFLAVGTFMGFIGLFVGAVSLGLSATDSSKPLKFSLAVIGTSGAGILMISCSFYMVKQLYYDSPSPPSEKDLSLSSIQFVLNPNGVPHRSLLISGPKLPSFWVENFTYRIDLENYPHLKSFFNHLDENYFYIPVYGDGNCFYYSVFVSKLYTLTAHLIHQKESAYDTAQKWWAHFQECLCFEENELFSNWIAYPNTATLQAMITCTELVEKSVLQLRKLTFEHYPDFIKGQILKGDFPDESQSLAYVSVDVGTFAIQKLSKTKIYFSPPHPWPDKFLEEQSTFIQEEQERDAFESQIIYLGPFEKEANHYDALIPKNVIDTIQKAPIYRVTTV